MMHPFMHDLLASCHSSPKNVLIVNDNARVDADALLRLSSRSTYFSFLPTSEQEPGQQDRRDRWHTIQRQASDSCLVRPQRRSSNEIGELSSISDHSVLPARLHVNVPQHRQQLQWPQQTRPHSPRPPTPPQVHQLIRWNSADDNKLRPLFDSDLSERSRHELAKKGPDEGPRPTIDRALSMPKRLQSPPGGSRRSSRRLSQLDDSTHLIRMERLKQVLVRSVLEIEDADFDEC